MGRYKGRIAGWDVVNEALNEDGTLRKSQWLKIIGDDYIAKAFQFAHEADPAAELYYNDYSLENEAKRKGAIELVKKLKARGVPIAAVGLQGHDKLDWPTVQPTGGTIEAFATLGIKVNITELDVDVLPRRTRREFSRRFSHFHRRRRFQPLHRRPSRRRPTGAGQRYAELFDVFVEHRAAIARVTFWGVTDGDSWKNDFPIRGRTNYPLLFDRQGKPKPAFDSVVGSAHRAK